MDYLFGSYSGFFASDPIAPRSHRASSAASHGHRFRDRYEMIYWTIYFSILITMSLCSTASRPDTAQDGGLPNGTLFTDFIYMGFPKRVFDAKSNSSFSFDGKRVCLSSTSYICPRYRGDRLYSLLSLA